MSEAKTIPVMRKPKRKTGNAKPDPYDFVSQERGEMAEEIVSKIWVDTHAQRNGLNAFLKYMRNAKKKGHGKPLGGRRLSQFSQAGKSAIAERLIEELKEEAISAGLVPNPFRVIHVTIDSRMTVKMLFLKILNRLADDFLDEPTKLSLDITQKEMDGIRGKTADNVTILEQRIEKWVQKLGVELMVIDEVQLLATNGDRDVSDAARDLPFQTADAFDVTKKLQSFIDRGVVPIVFIGDETSTKFFGLNGQFAARLGKPLELPPLEFGKTSHRKQFLEFCTKYDRELRKRGAVPVETCLTEKPVLTALMTASGGHIGRAARIIQIATVAAVERGAATLEAYDLSNTVRDYAIGLKWVDHDPFSIMHMPVALSGSDDSGADAAEASQEEAADAE